MGQFKPMVKMMTTEPSIELKLKKGGHVAMPKMKSKSSADGHKKMAAGGSALTRTCGTGGEMQGTAPAKPSMANRRAAMKGLQKHAALPASKAHKGLKTGGVAMGQGGYANGGIIKSTKGETMMHTAKPDHSPAKTGGVKMGNAGGYKKGGNVKKMALGGMTGYLQGVKNRVTAPSAGSGTGSPRPFGPRGSGPNDAGPMGPRPKPRGPLPQAIDYPRPSTPKKMATGGRAPLPQAINKPTSMVPGSRRPLPQAINKPSKPSKPLLSGADYDKYMPGGPNNPLRVPTKKSGGAARYAKGGGVEGNVSSTPAGVTNTTTGGVRKGNAGGYKKGGAPKKFARGGSVNDSGKAEKMPQKSPPTPVSINRLSGTYKKGGSVKKYLEGGPADVAEDKQRKAMQKAYEDTPKYQRELEQAMNPLDMLKEAYDKAVEMFGKKPSGESVTKTKESVTVTPLKKRYGGAC